MTDDQFETPKPGTETRKGRHLTVVTDNQDQTGQTEAKPVKKGSASRSARNLDTGLTDKQEAFCQAITSQGMSLSDAWRSAYNASGMTPKSVNECASRLFVDVKIVARLRQIADEAAERRRMLAVSDAQLALDVLRLMSRKADTDASKIRAAELLAKAAGVFTEQVEITDKTDRSEAEIEQAIADRLRRLGLTG